MKKDNSINLEKYASLIFDCDGVILNSNKVKTQAFYNAALPYGKEAAMMLVDYHVANGGISRYKKFDLFLNKMISDKADGPGLDELLKCYASEVRSGLLNCDIAEGLSELRKATKHTNWLIVSGGDQSELREIFFERELNAYFDGGIFGSPDTKDQILQREIIAGNIQKPALFFGDSKYDFEAAKRAQLDFVFVSDWSESRYIFSGAKHKINKLSCMLS